MDRLSDEGRRVLVWHRPIEAEGRRSGVHPALADFSVRRDRLDQGVGLNTSHKHGMHHPGHGDVIDVAALTGDQPRILHPTQGGPDHLPNPAQVLQVPSIMRQRRSRRDPPWLRRLVDGDGGVEQRSRHPYRPRKVPDQCGVFEEDVRPRHGGVVVSDHHRPPYLEDLRRSDPVLHHFLDEGRVEPGGDAKSVRFGGGQTMHSHEQVGDIFHLRAVAELAQVVRGAADGVEDRLSLLETLAAARSENDQRGVGGLEAGPRQRGVEEVDPCSGEDVAGSNLVRDREGAHLEADQTGPILLRDLGCHRSQGAGGGQGEDHQIRQRGNLVGRLHRFAADVGESGDPRRFDVEPQHLMFGRDKRIFEPWRDHHPRARLLQWAQSSSCPCRNRVDTMPLCPSTATICSPGGRLTPHTAGILRARADSKRWAAALPPISVTRPAASQSKGARSGMG